MERLHDLRQGQKAVIAAIDGEARTVNRAVSIGLTPGCKVEIIKNQKNRPLLVYSRDTMIALNRKECESIMVEEM
jgi:ferrous iron transport protein A